MSNISIKILIKVSEGLKEKIIMVAPFENDGVDKFRSATEGTGKM